MPKIAAVIICLLCATNLFAKDYSSIEVIAPEKATPIAYTSEDYNGFIPHWIIDGTVLPASEVKQILIDQGTSACTIWIFNLAGNGSPSKHELLESLLIEGKVLPLWKNISGTPIFEDLDSGHALSFVCIKYSPEEDTFIETNQVEYEQHFRGVLLLNKQ